MAVGGPSPVITVVTCYKCYDISMDIRNPNSVIYFVRSGTSGPIKIGKANNLKRRLASLQTSASEPLRVLGVVPGDIPEEAALHAQFADTRLHGEWFAPSDRLLAYIAEVSYGTEQVGPPVIVSRPRLTINDEASQRLVRAGNRKREADAELKAAVLAAKDAGGSVRVIAEQAQISTRTVQNWLAER